jgi:hypothetical protein
LSGIRKKLKPIVPLTGLILKKKRPKLDDPLKKEYRFDYRRAKPNRFLGGMSEGVVTVVLEPDVAAVFKSSKAVNALLRSVITAMPESKRHLG